MQRIPLAMSHDNFFCPVTGEQILSEDDGTPSSATVFIWANILGDFAFVNEEFRELYENFKENPDNEDADWFTDFLDKTERQDVVVFEITSHGLTCGPASDTSYIGIDICHDINEE